MLYALGLLLLLWRYARGHPDTLELRDALRLLPDVLRLVRRLAADRSLPWGLRVRLGLLLVYLLIPVDLVPDVIPILGYATTSSSSRSCCARSPAAPAPQHSRPHWPGSPKACDSFADSPDSNDPRFAASTIARGGPQTRV